MATASKAKTIESGVSTDYPSHWCSTRRGDLIRVNGIQRGSIWKTTDPDIVLELGITGPTLAPDVETDTGTGAAFAGNYWCAYRYVDAEGIPSSLSPTTCVVAVANDGFNWIPAAQGVDGIVKPTETRPTKVQLFRTTADQADVFYQVAELTLTDFTGIPLQYLTDDEADATLLAKDADEILPVLNDDRSLSARRFEPPPNDMAVCVEFQGRTWYGVPLAIAGSTMAGIADWEAVVVDRYVYLEGNARPLRITAAADPNLTLEDGTTQTLNASGVWIHPGPDDRNALFYSVEGEPESVPPSQNVLHFNESSDDHDDMQAVIPWGMAMWICWDRHTLRYSFAQDPRYDSSWRLAYARGCLNQRCWGFLDGVCYLIDQMGCWRMTSEGPDPIDAQIGDLFHEGTIDFSKRDSFFVSVDPRERVVRFHVLYTTDSETRPIRALCYHAPSQAWATESYPIELGGATKVTIGDEFRAIVGGDKGRVLLMGEGYEDLGTTAIEWELITGMMPIPADETMEGVVHLVYPPTTGAETCDLEIYYDHNSRAETYLVPHKDGGASVAAGASAISIDMQLGRSVQGNAPGYDKWPLHVRSDERALSHRFVSVKLSGSQQDEAIAISSLGIG